MKSFSIYLGIAAISLVLFFNCKKENNPNNQSAPTCCVNKNFNMTVTDWQFFSEETLNLKPPGSATYQSTSEGIKFMAQAYRLGGRISALSDLCLKNTTIKTKWKANGGGQFADYRISLYYDRMGYGGDDSKRIDFTSLTTANTYNGSVLIQNDVWYYTRIVITDGQATSYTATGNYDDQGGQVIQTKQTNITGPHAGFLAARLGDPFASAAAYMVVAEYTITSNQ